MENDFMGDFYAQLEESNAERYCARVEKEIEELRDAARNDSVEKSLHIEQQKGSITVWSDEPIYGIDAVVNFARFRRYSLVVISRLDGRTEFHLSPF